MVKVTIKNIQQNKERVTSLLKKIIADRQLNNEIGEMVVKNIKASVRMGKNPETGERFAELAESTKEKRVRMEKYNPTSEFYSKNKSNLHFSGQLVDGITHDVKTGNGETVIEIESKGNRMPYLTAQGKPQKGGVGTNEELSEIHNKTGRVIRKFLGVSEKMRKQIKDKIRAGLRRILKT